MTKKEPLSIRLEKDFIRHRAMKRKNMDQEKIILDVKVFAKRAHANDIRKFGADKGKSYFDTHVTRVSQRALDMGATEEQYLAALLHDVKEDHPEHWSEEVLKGFGVTQLTLDIVDAVTKRKDENYFDFIQRIIKTPDAILVKIADIQDNISDLNEGSMKDKYRFALHMLKSEKNCNDWVTASNEGNV